MDAPRWRIYYEGGAVCDSLNCEPGDAPANGVLSVVQLNDCGHHPSEWLKPEGKLDTKTPVELFEGADWYWWRPDHGKWFRGDLMGFLDQAMHCGAVHPKQGRYVTHEQWEKTLMRVQSDRDFPH